MAPRRVAAALASDDTLEDSIRQDILGAQGDDQQQDGDDQQQDDQDQGDDQQQDDQTLQAGDDQQQDDQDQGDDQQDDQPVQRRAAREDRLSPAAEARIAEAERVAAEAVARANALSAQFQQPRESPEAEAARLALMTPEQVTEYKVNKALGQHSKLIAQQIFSTQNSADQAVFNSTIASNPQLKKFAVEVETKHATLVREAQHTGAQVPTRQTVLTYMLGERALKLAEKAAPQARDRQQRVQRQTVRAPDARSGVSTQRRQTQTAEQRLENQPI